MSDERYRKLPPDYLGEGKEDPFFIHKWSQERLKDEKKRLSLMSLVPFLGLFLLLYFMQPWSAIQVEDDVLKASLIAWVGHLAFHAIYMIPAWIFFSRLNSPGFHFIPRWLDFLHRQLKHMYLLYVGLVLLIWSMVNITYESKGGWMLKMVMTLLISFAVGMLFQYLWVEVYKRKQLAARNKRDEWKQKLQK